MIDEKKLIEDIINTPSKVMNEIPYEKTMFDNIHKRQNEILDVVNRQPKVGEWIPCSERLPEEPITEHDGYIVQQADGIEPFSAYWNGQEWFDSVGVLAQIIAWMPLPESYKVGDQE